MIDSIAGNLAKIIKNGNPDETSSIDIMKFSLIALLNGLFVVVFTLILGIVLGLLKEVVISLISFFILRAVSGGYHLKSSDICVAVSTFLFIFIAYTSQFIVPIKIYLIVITIILVAIYAPSKIEEQTNIPKKYFGLLKVVSLIMVFTTFYLDNNAIVLSFFVQSLLLIHWSKKGGEKYD